MMVSIEHALANEELKMTVVKCSEIYQGNKPRLYSEVTFSHPNEEHIFHDFCIADIYP